MAKFALLSALVSCLLLIHMTAPSSGALSRIFRHGDRRPHPSDNVGKSLSLSSYIESGRIEEGRRAAEVNIEQLLTSPGSGRRSQLLAGRRVVDPPRVSYSGFINVNKTCDSNLFFWFIPAKVISYWIFNVPSGPLPWRFFFRKKYKIYVVSEIINSLLDRYRTQFLVSPDRYI